MFTGIIEALGKVESVTPQGENVDLVVASPISDELKVDQSVSHNGCCLTVTAVQDGKHTVTAVQETLAKTNIGALQEGNIVNLERAMPATGRFDGHIVQGHVDQVATVAGVEEQDGSWKYTFTYTSTPNQILVEKGSTCINGVSLTVFEVSKEAFSVAIIPFTYEHTNFNGLAVGDKVNMEFDIVGKYIAAMHST